MGGAKESAPCGQGQAGADGNAPDAEISELGDRELAIETGNEDVDRFWRNRFHDLLNLVRFPDAGRVKTISPSLSVRDKPVKSDAKWIRTRVRQTEAAIASGMFIPALALAPYEGLPQHERRQRILAELEARSRTSTE